MESSRDAAAAVPDAVDAVVDATGQIIPLSDPDEVKKMIENMYGK